MSSLKTQFISPRPPQPSLKATGMEITDETFPGWVLPGTPSPGGALTPTWDTMDGGPQRPESTGPARWRLFCGVTLISAFMGPLPGMRACPGFHCAEKTHCHAGEEKWVVLRTNSWTRLMRIPSLFVRKLPGFLITSSRILTAPSL